MELQQATTSEWLETNGLGGFASGTLCGLNTRRYHGLLVVATKPPVGRVVLLSKLEETLVVDGVRYDLSANQYPGGVTHPRGHELLAQFQAAPWPTFEYAVAGGTLTKSVFMIHGENTTVLRYRWSGPSIASLELRPLIAFRDYHALTHENTAINSAVEQIPGCAILRPYGDLPPLCLNHTTAEVEVTGHWYRRFQCAVEQERGLDFEEDLFQPLVLRFTLTEPAVVAASTQVRAPVGPEQRERARRQGLGGRLQAAADQFLVRRGEFASIIAGYPWFSDWGRDTMIALPGLTLATGRYGVAQKILLAFAEHLSEGMLPNRFPDAGEAPEYNTVDATLWFVDAIRACGDQRLARDLYPALRSIIEWHLRGTRYGIRADVDGLLNAGVPGVQLTWMDAKVGDWVVTPRHGKPVEIQALWYNALRVVQQYAEAFADPEFAAVCRSTADRAAAAFATLFWNHDQGCLFDCIGPEGPDPSIRPNQIFAVSLQHPLLQGDRARQVVEVVRRELLTPMGLRTLAPGDPLYRPHYRGGVLERDSAYHQGTVWPWLIGPFLTAYLTVEGDSEAARAQARTWLQPLLDNTDAGCIGQICEVADGDAPHTPGGCFAQAWSVAEVLRLSLQLA